MRAADDEELTEPTVDLVEACEQLAQATQSEEVRRDATALIGLLRSPTFIARHNGVGPGASRLHGVGVYVPHVGLDARANIFTVLGLQHARLWTRATERLRESDRHAKLLAAIDVFEAELRALDPELQAAASIVSPS